MGGMFQRPEERYDPKALDAICRELQPYTAERLTHEDAAEIATNMARYLDLLSRWAEERRNAPPVPESHRDHADPEEAAHA